MRRVLGLYETSVGKKVLMASTGLILFGFVVVHMLGNLKIFTGEAHFNAYAIFLRTVGDPAVPEEGLLWAFRVVLLGCVGVHIVAALQLWLTSRGARSQGYVKNDDLSFSYASRTMRWGGLIILSFVVFHLLHLTFGTVHPDFAGPGHEKAVEVVAAGTVNPGHGAGTVKEHVNAYHNVVTGFQNLWVSLAYMVAMVFLGLHIYHGVWSVTQTLSLTGSRIKKLRRPFAAAVAAVVVLGNISIPLSILLGWVE
jgi:succinate dehydrogenase / fumarate reductase cytochrome b subunit